MDREKNIREDELSCLRKKMELEYGCSYRVYSTAAMDDPINEAICSATSYNELEDALKTSWEYIYSIEKHNNTPEKPSGALQQFVWWLVDSVLPKQQPELSPWRHDGLRHKLERLEDRKRCELRIKELSSLGG